MDTILKLLEKIYLPFEHWLSTHVDLSHCFHYIIANIIATILLILNVNVFIVPIIILLIGIAKELFDKNRYGKFDTNDIIATVLGSVTPIMLILLT